MTQCLISGYYRDNTGHSKYFYKGEDIPKGWLIYGSINIDEGKAFTVLVGENPITKARLAEDPHVGQVLNLQGPCLEDEQGGRFEIKKVTRNVIDEFQYIHILVERVGDLDPQQLVYWLSIIR